jgi:hypothetical protein
MNATVDIEYQEYAQAFSEFIRERGALLPKALRGEGRQLASRLVKFTPPKTLAQGRKAVARDIQRAVLPLRPGDFDSKRIRQLIRKRDHSALEAVFANFPDRNQLHGVSVIEPRFPDMHQQARDRRGRIRKFQKVVTPDADKVRAYIKEVQGRVGRGRSGWAVALLALGGKPQAWVVRHARRDTGRFEDRSSMEGYIRMENRSEWAEAGDEDRIVANAVRSRTRSVRESILKAQQRAAEKARLN